ncbi:DUF4932 domain-containing protein [Anditalea andensis]|uniref:DUF4932 domain-containing protein n=1 Tax=Anditalea andensis TaxID=1048983 RepID=A0A074L389_9BACT|nr:DUF4932 domain-containing protein [Anditalea andensis]KEO75609.1 hypothetical protein EL17_00520 [Anditalea andensis]
MKISIQILIILILSLESASSQTFNAYVTMVNGIEYRIDPRIELFNIVAMQIGHSGMTLSNIPYKQQALKRFSDYQAHPAPKVLRETWEKGWGIDDPMFFLLYLNEDFSIKEELDTDIITRGGGKEQLESLAASLKEYAEASDFYSFFNDEQKDFYEQVLFQTRYNFRSFEAVDVLENFYGKGNGKYTVMLNLISDYGNFGKIMELGGVSLFYAIISTPLASGDVPVFKPNLSTQELILHEFSHGFVNPQVNPFSDRLSGYSPLYGPIEQAMKSQAYHHWHTVVNEHVVRAAVLEMLSQELPEILVRNTLYRKEMGRQFIYIDKIREKLAGYQQNREVYPSFKDFVPELITVFDEITPDYITGRINEPLLVEMAGNKKIPKPYDFQKDSTTFFIVGTKEPDPIAQQEMHAFADEYRQMFSKDIRFLTDEEALEMDLKNHDLVLFGTVEGNLLLKKHMSNLPISISEKGVVTNRFIEGEDLQLVTSWISPYNKEKSFIVYTAQKTKNIKNFYHSMHKDQFHYWVAKDLITIDKGDYKKYWNIWMVDIFE